MMQLGSMFISNCNIILILI